MPEEINRLVTDALAERLFTHSPEAREHLLLEGRPDKAIHFVGNVMVDALDAHIAAARARPILADAGLVRGRYAVLTLHRPSNVDEPAALAQLLAILEQVTGELDVIFPVHPRTQARLEAARQSGARIPERLRLLPPLGYLDFIALLDGAKLALTDSGGVQEETTALSIPCLTLRENTERPITCRVGSNQLVGRDPAKVRRALAAILAGDFPRGTRPPLWDGHAAERIVEVWSRT
ncbi:MAG TPA: UDP-N-acetylglucosamine 2-epimerase, partial [Polyangia bacterium]|nr:UDP-N-acetylglucosamine 2-epimerase [Polyangia bacterium]